ncbi:MAG TPA: GNAT family N-acetyltransferase [Propionibacteriaceae bacterium]|nr:GNAT family N-acetyltransferase [Propionibacteriaceae bacterium]
MPVLTPEPVEGFVDVTITADSLPSLLRLDTWAFPSPVPAAEQREWPWPLEPQRTRGLAEPGSETLAAMHGSYAYSRFPVPGATTPVAGLTAVGVHPQYRGRGLLRSMIGTHFADCRERGEIASVLFASQPALYPRFGYGLASRTVALTIARHAALRSVRGSHHISITFDEFDLDRHGPIVAELHARGLKDAINQPGWATRETPRLREHFHSDPPALRDGFEKWRIIVAHRSDDAVGYALFRRKFRWGEAGPEGPVDLKEYAATDPAAAHALWTRLLDLELTRTVEAHWIALDDPILGLLVDPRAATPRIIDNLWLRLIDVPAALRTRRYAAAVDVSIEVVDEMLPENAGCWHLTADAFSDRVEVEACDRADVRMDVRTLGSLYLGGFSASALAAAGQLEGTPQALAALSSAFGWPRLPACSWVF